MKKTTAELLLLLTAALLISGCSLRTRLLPDAESTALSGPTSGFSGEGLVPPDAESPDDPALSGRAAPQKQDEPEPDAPTREDPRSERREYDPLASAELSEGEQAVLFLPEDAVDRASFGVSPASEAILAEQASLTATEILTQDEAQKLGVSEEAPRADSVYRYYRALLDSRLSTLFECKRMYVYWESSAEHVTVFKTSPEHEIIVMAGCYDVAVKRQADALLVDDGWIARKAPGCIVKAVNGDTLGEGIRFSGPARSIAAHLVAREGWERLDAVRGGRILLLSESLAAAPAGRLAAALFLAKTCYADLFADLDPEEAARQLLFEESGRDADGTFAYVWEG